jgi:hypothetical protein
VNTAPRDTGGDRPPLTTASAAPPPAAAASAASIGAAQPQAERQQGQARCMTAMLLYRCLAQHKYGGELFMTANCTEFSTVSSTCMDRHYIEFLVALLVLYCSLWWTAIHTMFLKKKKLYGSSIENLSEAWKIVP